jgi:hypothetical protein
MLVKLTLNAGWFLQAEMTRPSEFKTGPTVKLLMIMKLLGIEDPKYIVASKVSTQSCHLCCM